MSAAQAVIRKFRSEDRQAVRDICVETALMGEPASLFFEGDDIFADALTRYFTDFEPQSCFVSEMQGEVVGYLIGAKDAAAVGKIFQEKIFWGLLGKAVASGFFIKKKNLIFMANFLGSVLKGEFKQPDFSREYPATLHINVRVCCRGSGIGAKLIEAYLGYLAKEGVQGVHFATMSERATSFFEREHFSLLYRAPRSYLRNILRKDFFVSVFGRRLA